MAVSSQQYSKAFKTLALNSYTLSIPRYPRREVLPTSTKPFTEIWTALKPPTLHPVSHLAPCVPPLLGFSTNAIFPRKVNQQKDKQVAEFRVIHSRVTLGENIYF